MPLWLNPTGRSTYGIALCGRCSEKFFLDELFPDPNSPGLMVCKDDLDVLDPYRLAPPPPDQITLPFVRPDVSIALTDDEPTPSTGEPYTFWADDFYAADFWAPDFWA